MAKNKANLQLSDTAKELINISKTLGEINGQMSAISHSMKDGLTKSLKDSNKEAKSLEERFKNMKSGAEAFTSVLGDKLLESFKSNKLGGVLTKTYDSLFSLKEDDDYKDRLGKYKQSKAKYKDLKKDTKVGLQMTKALYKDGIIDKDTYKKTKSVEQTKLKNVKDNGKDTFNTGNTIGKIVGAGMGSIVAMGISSAIKLSEKIFNEAKKMIDNVSTYSISSSYKVNSEARNQMLEYGLSESQNYAFSQVKELMGISSDEDMFWMNDNQRQMFSQLMTKETELYNKMTSNGSLESFQKMQIDMAILKQEFYANVVQFIAQHKDLIVSAMETGIGALTGIMYIVGGILTAISKLNPANWSTYSGNKTITLNNYVSTTNSNASSIADETTNKTLASLSTYANS